MADERALELLRIRALGPFVVEGVAERDLGSRQGRTVLKVLAIARGRPVSVDRLADALWGDERVARPADQVGVLVSRLRGVLGPDRIERTDAGYRLRADWLDLDELDERGSEAAAALADGRIAAARAAADAALALVQGPVLVGDDGEWIASERRVVDATVAGVRAVAIEAASAAGDHRAVSALAEGGLSADPYDEVVLRLLMASHAAAGRPAAGLSAYARVRARLAEDLGVSPTVETEALHDRLLGIGAGPAGDPVEAAATGPTGPTLVGRDREWSRLDAAFEQARAGRTAAVAVVGEAGIGKSTLVAAWSASRAAHGVVVLSGRCDELGRDLPLQPVVDALSGRLAGLDEAAAALVLGADALTLSGVVGLAPVGPDAEATVVVDAEQGRLRLYRALLAAVVRAGGSDPAVLVVEDIHQAGPSTLGWLAFAARQAASLVLVTTGRSGAPSVPGAEVIELGPLDRAAIDALVGAARAEALHERSGGHPLLLMALAGAAADAVPDTVVDTAHQWVAAIGDAGPTIEAAAVLGHEVDLDLLAEVLRAPAVSLLAHLEAAAAIGLLVEQGAGYAFRHEVVREALDGSTGSTRRALVHRAAARILDARTGADPLVVAIHARLGGDIDLAQRRFVQAARVAESRFDVASAEAHLAAALALGPSAEASTEQARVHMARRDLDAAEASVADAFADGGTASTWEVAAWIAYYRRRYQDARTFADEGLRLAVDAAGRASCLSVGGRTRHGEGELLDAVAMLEEAVAEPAPPSVHGVALVWLGHTRVHQGRPDDAVELIDRALLTSGPLAHPFAPLHGRFARVVALGQLGRAADALAALDDLDHAIVIAGEVGHRFIPIAANTRGWVLRWTGRSDEADECNQIGVEGAHMGDAWLEPVYAGWLDLADGRLLAGDIDGAADIGSAELSSLDTWGGGMGWSQRHRLGLLRTRLALADGDRDRAGALASAVATDAAQRGARRHELLAQALLGLADGLAIETLDQVIAALGRCAGLDGWRVIAELATHHRIDRWRTIAVDRAASLVAASGEDRESAAPFVGRLLG